MARFVNAALPPALVATLGVPCNTAPLGPDASVAVTDTSLSLTGLPFASSSCTTGCWASTAPLCAALDGSVVSASLTAVPAVPVAVNDTGLPVIPLPAAVAVSVFVFTVAGSVQLPTVAIPLPSVVCVPPVTLPLPAAGVNVTATSATGFPFASLTITDGGDVTAVPAVADWLVGLFAAIVVAAPAVPVAVNVTGLPVSDPDVAVSVFDPAVALRVHEVRVAIPSDPVLTGVVGVTVPLPAAGVNVTATPPTGFPFASFTITDGGDVTAVPAVADWLVGLFAAIAAAAPAVPVAVKVTGLPVSDPDVAVRVLLPAVALSVQLPTVAMPLPLVVCVPPVTLPLPAAGVNVTATSATGFPFASFTITDGGEPTAVPTVAVWLVGLFAAIVAAVPAVPVALKVTGLPLKPVEVAVSVFGPAVALSVQLPTVATPLALVV